MPDKTRGQLAYEAYYGASGGKSLASGAQLPEWAAQDVRIRSAWEAAGDAAAQPRVGELLKTAGLMAVGIEFADADPVARCLVGGCKWHGHGDALADATNAWLKHLTTDHRNDWPED